MYDLPPDFDCQLLSGCFLEMVCFGPLATNLHFARPSTPGKSYDVTFGVQGTISFGTAGSTGSRDLKDPGSCAPLIGLLMSDVSSVSRSEQASLRISFVDGSHILIHGENREFECYTIWLPDREMIIV